MAADTAEMTAEQKAHELGDALRTLAAWIEEHPHFASSLKLREFFAYPGDTPETVAEWARAMKPARKEFDDAYGLFRLVREFGPITLKAVFWRETVCRKVIKGTREITKEISDPAAAKITVTETVEDVEWVCEPILAVANEAVA